MPFNVKIFYLDYCIAP